MTHIRAVAKERISEIMPSFTDRDDFVAEYAIEKGKNIAVDFDEKTNRYQYRLHTKTNSLTREELEEKFLIVWEYGAYNTCIRDGVPCAKLRGVEEGSDARDPRRSGTSCRIHWEVGRGACSEYEAKKREDDEHE